jgi:hypothetical protein
MVEAEVEIVQGLFDLWQIPISMITSYSNVGSNTSETSRNKGNLGP